LLLIIISSVNIAFENPLDDVNSTKHKIIRFNELIINSIFLIEIALKVIANGLVFNGQQSYMRNIYNFVDFIIVLVSFVSVFSNISFFKSLKIIRIFRLLKPLRVINKN